MRSFIGYLVIYFKFQTTPALQNKSTMCEKDLFYPEGVSQAFIKAWLAEMGCISRSFFTRTHAHLVAQSIQYVKPVSLEE